MRTSDLVDRYIDAVIARDVAGEYEAQRPALFAHYHEFWSARRPYRRDWDVAELRGKRDLVRSTLERLDGEFARHGLDLAELEIVLFVGHGTTNGHAYREGGRFVVWIPVETYGSARLANVFLTHEILHALHYTASPGFYFENREEQSRIGRMLITEGLATYLTTVVLDVPEEEALWGGHLPDGQLTGWLAQCERRYGEMCSFFLANFDNSLREHGLFCLGDTGNVFQSRGGYFAGMRLIRRTAETLAIPPLELLHQNARSLEDLILKLLATANAG
ncbi:MAG: hypothetical protein HZB43_03730 [candidate division Zixibacteria bacterium]|nr:hypothetical protein [candidate division Zixibacteria bacterium]